MLLVFFNESIPIHQLDLYKYTYKYKFFFG